MNREEFLNDLQTHLHGLSDTEIQDILWDYEEHFNIGLSKGKSEEEISRELGKPSEIAKNYNQPYKNYQENESYVNTDHNDRARKLLIILLLVFFNMVVVLTPYLVAVGLLIGLYGIGIGFVFGGIALLFGLPFTFFIPIPSPHFLTGLGFGVGLGALGLLAIIAGISLTKLFITLTKSYIKWNLKIING